MKKINQSEQIKENLTMIIAVIILANQIAIIFESIESKFLANSKKVDR